MTNGEMYSTLTVGEQIEFRKVYNEHPLADYIDWDSYYKSENGNALDFVNYISKYTDDNGNTVFVLEECVEDDMDYCLIFVCGDNTFYKVPAEA